jgi:hypothetical protein
MRMHLQNLQKYGSITAMTKVDEGGKPNNRVSKDIIIIIYDISYHGMI